jgi:hypothetical protein
MKRFVYTFLDLFVSPWCPSPVDAPSNSGKIGAKSIFNEKNRIPSQAYIDMGFYVNKQGMRLLDDLWASWKIER